MTLSCANGFGFQKPWVAQALAAITEHPDIFHKSQMDSAMNYFGIGNKKVEALQFWMRAAGLAQISSEGFMALTPLGSLVLQYDPNCDADGTWWFVHIQLSRAKTEPGLRDSTTWRWYTHRFMEVRFTKERLRAALAVAHPEAAERTIASAINELVNSALGCPIGQMGLLSVDGDDFVRHAPSSGRMHPSTLGFAIMQWAMDRNRSGQTVHLSELASGTDSIRGLFTLPEARFVEELSRLSGYYGAGVFGFNTTAGLNSFVLYEANPLIMAEAYYREVMGGMTPKKALEESQRAHR